MVLSFPGTVMATDALLTRSPSAAARGLLVTSSCSGSLAAATGGGAVPPRLQEALRGGAGRYAAYGYEAMAVMLDAIRRAGDQGDSRDAVVDAFFDTQDRDSVLGIYSIDEVGDTTLGRLAGYRLAGGRPRLQTSLRVP